jgi:adenine-specific DNA methylase
MDKMDKPRLIERAFPLKQTSLDSVHEKNVRHGHISTLHIWPARRPLAACRAALIATLLPDPGTPEKRKELCEKFAGKIVEKREKKKLPNGEIVERVTEETEGGILHWKRETENKDTLEWFRQEIRKAYGGRAPKVLDPFAGGGAIPMEAMRLGCEVFASDLNPVSWFVLKATLDYPQKFAGQKYPLPNFILKDRAFMTRFLLSEGLPETGIAKELEKLGLCSADDLHLPGLSQPDIALEADLAWHVRAWGRRILDEARKELVHFYPTYADFEPIKEGLKSYEKQPSRLVSMDEDGRLDLVALNSRFSEAYLRNGTNPRWVAKPTVAYLWARTVTCKNCRATVPLLKTRWLCKKANKRILLTMEPNAERSGVIFGIDSHVAKGDDKNRGQGTMSRAGTRCPCCSTIMTMEDLRLEGKAGRLGLIPTAVITESQATKVYRLPTQHEIDCALKAEDALASVFCDVPFGLPTEPTPAGGGTGASRAFSIQGYGLMQWRDLFTARQLLTLGTLVKQIRIVIASDESGLPSEWREAIGAYLAVLFDKAADYSSTVCTWHNSRELIGHTFARFALPITWDVAECATLNDVGGAVAAHLDWIARFIDSALGAAKASPSVSVTQHSATQPRLELLDVVLTDPPYYDAIPYSDCMDFFYIWLKRIVHETPLAASGVFSELLSPKWDADAGDGELIDDSSRHEGNADRSKLAYEDGMARAFAACHKSLQPDGRLVIVFAHKHPDAWETLVAAIVRSGFIVDASWPIQTEMGTRMRAMSSAALSSSVWLVCRKRPPCRPGWVKDVVKEMQANIQTRLTEFWDAGIRGPDFVWAAMGPALEAYSRYPVVKTDDPEKPTLSISEFLAHARRLVIDFVVGRVLSGGEASDMQMADRLDGVTAYYLLHRNDFGMEPAPSGACILYALSCGVSDHDLAQVWGLTMSAVERKTAEDTGKADDDGGEEDETSSSGSEARLRAWTQRKAKSLGYEAPGGREVPIIDRIHRLMHLWSEGDVQKVDAYLDDNALRRNELFRRVLQAIIELAEEGCEERSLLESISNHIQGKGAVVNDKQKKLEI